MKVPGKSEIEVMNHILNVKKNNECGSQPPHSQYINLIWVAFLMFICLE